MNTPPQREFHSAHTMTGPTQTQEEDLGYVFATSSSASQWTADVLPKPQPVSTSTHG